MKTIDTKTVRHVALLSRLSLDEKELEVYSRQLTSIISYINKLDEVNTEGVQPTSHAVSSLRNVFRKDLPKKSLTPKEALENAPAKEGNYFKVPKIVEGR